MTKQWTASHWEAALHGYVPGLLLGMGVVGAATINGTAGSILVGIACFTTMVLSHNAGEPAVKDEGVTE